MGTTRKVNVTKSYRLFELSEKNRPLNIGKHKRLERSMKEYGFLACFPIVCCRNGDKHLVVKDGQHRLAIAENLGLPVYWIEETIDFDVAVVNNGQLVWVPRDYALSWAARGVEAYKEGIEFADAHRLPVAVAFGLLAGTVSYRNVWPDFIAGTFKIKDRLYAQRVASIYSATVAMAPRLRNARFIEACMAVCRIESFDLSRFTQGLDRCREKLVPYSTRDAYLDMIEAVYNFGRKNLSPLKVSALQAMRERNPRHGKKER